MNFYFQRHIEYKKFTIKNLVHVRLFYSNKKSLICTKFFLIPLILKRIWANVSAILSFFWKILSSLNCISGFKMCWSSIHWNFLDFYCTNNSYDCFFHISLWNLRHPMDCSHTGFGPTVDYSYSYNFLESKINLWKLILFFL